MKIINVMFDDWDSPLLGQMVVPDDTAEETAERVRGMSAAFKVEITEPASEDDIARQAKIFEEEGEEKT